MATPFACSFSTFYIYQAVILLFHIALHPPFLSLSVHMSLSLSLSVVPRPVFLISGLSMRFGVVDSFFFAIQISLQLLRHIHYPVNPSDDHFHTDAVVPSSDHCRTEIVLPPSDHYCIES